MSENEAVAQLLVSNGFLVFQVFFSFRPSRDIIFHPVVFFLVELFISPGNWRRDTDRFIGEFPEKEGNVPFQSDSNVGQG